MGKANDGRWGKEMVRRIFVPTPECAQDVTEWLIAETAEDRTQSSPPREGDAVGSRGWGWGDGMTGRECNKVEPHVRAVP